MKSDKLHTKPARFTTRIVLFCGLMLLALRVAGVAGQPPAMVEATDAKFNAIDAYIEAEMAATRLPGLALGIVEGDQIVHLRGFGQADSSGRVVSPQTPFLIASVTKSISAIAIMQLVEAGLLELDAPVQRYLPWFTVADPEAATRITVRQLLSHSSGLPTLTDEDGMVFDPSLGEDALTMRVQALGQTSLQTVPGVRFSYSNAGYATLALLIQTVSGQSYAQYLQAHIYGPLGMNNSFVAKSEAQGDGLATGHRYLFGFPISYDWSYNLAELGAGFTYASAEDLSHLMLALLNEGRYNDAQLLSAATIAEMQQPQVTFAMGEIESAYGLGWFISDAEGTRIMSHAGVAPNYRAELILVPQRKLGIVVLMNGESQLKPRIGHIAQGVTSLLIGQELPATAGDATASIFSLVLVVSVVQAVILGGSIYLLRRWQHRTSKRPSSPVRLGFGLLPLIVIHLLWGLFCLFIVPRLLFWPLPDLTFKLPDLGYSLLTSGTLALVWAIVYPILAYLILFRHNRDQSPGLPMTA